ncbi:MAG: acetamidase/formamidase family protein [Acidaminococcales bacterium]|jgi:amidase|nr:acetamidase/formamidase family protein [Acidaminococcales bacterium]
MTEKAFVPAENYVLSLSKDAPPVATVKQGTPVCFETRDCFSNRLETELVPFTSVSWEHINPATGPVFIEGAQAGDILRVDILDIQVAEKGVIGSAPGFGALPDSVGEVTRIVPIKDGRALFAWPRAGGLLRRALPIRPMIGVIGVAPPAEAVPTGTPGMHGGNMDCKRIVKNAVLYLPVFVKGALFALGDLHALMGDGEVVVCGLEIPGQVTVSFQVIKDLKLPLPLLVEGGALMALASAGTLDAAASLAARNMQGFLTDALGMDKTAAAMLLSIEGNLCVCQVVDPLKTARMEISLDILEQAAYELP